MRYIMILLFAVCLQVSSSLADAPLSSTEPTWQLSAIISGAFSLAALALSFLALYYARLSRPKIKILAGVTLTAQHDGFGRCLISVPVSVENYGAILATVRRFALLIREKGMQKGYLLEPIAFQKLGEDGDFVNVSLDVPIAVSGHGSENRQVLFTSSGDEFEFTKAGMMYEFTIFALYGQATSEPAKESFNVQLSEPDANELKEQKRKQKGKDKNEAAIFIKQYRWKQWTSHPVSKSEVKNFLGGRQDTGA